MGIMRGLCCKIEQRCIRNSAGQCADSWVEGDCLFDCLKGSHYDEFCRKKLLLRSRSNWISEFAVHTSVLLLVSLFLLVNMRVQTLKYSAFRILWRNRLSPFLHIPTHYAGIIRNYSIHAPVYQLLGNIQLIYLKKCSARKLMV